MKRFKAILLSMAIASTAMAQEYITDGYYRVQNEVTQRYIRVVDNHGAVNIGKTTADMGALKTVLGYDRVISDPGTIIHITTLDKSKHSYNLGAQGTTVYNIIQYFVRLSWDWEHPYCYEAYGESNGMVKYICDNDNSVYDLDEEEYWYGDVNTTLLRNKWWYLRPLDATSENSFLGITPEVEVNGKYYKTFYADFPFNFASTGMKAFYVKTVDEKHGFAVTKDVTTNVPKATPVIIECSSNDPYSNRLNIGVEAAGSLSDNKLKGNYFFNPSTNVNHRNVLAYDPTTMRVLGTNENGELAFVQAADQEFIPANTAYITVSANAPAVLTIIDENAGVEGIRIDQTTSYDVYTLQGQKVRSKVTSMEGLSKGVYIRNGQKVLVK
jgi:hypothetical protein